MVTGEVKVITARDFHHIAINGDVKTIGDVIRAVGLSPENCTVRVGGELTSDFNMEADPAKTITAFNTQTVATAGMKGGNKSN